jgi:C4-dicarboxylate-specific signal transduction histidine kinase
MKNDEKDWTTLEVNQVVQDVLKIVSGTLLQANVQLVLKLSDESACVQGNRIQLQLLILNLVLNAVEAMNKNVVPRKLIVETLNDGTGLAVISVTDNGPGIPKEIRNRLFDPFFTTKVQGLGVGLSICRAIATAHGGHLSVINGKDHGATFFVTLPTATQGTICPKIRARLSS